MLIIRQFQSFSILCILVLYPVICINAQPLSGNYTINAALPTGGTNFSSIGDFAGTINANGVSGNVIATIVPGSGPYNEQAIFNAIPGTGPSATVVLEGSGETVSALTTTTDRYVIRLTNCQYFVVNNLNIVWNPASTGGFYGIHIYSTGNFITISNCHVEIPTTTSTLYGAYIASGSETSILETGDFHNISITNNTSNGGGYGASLFGLVTNLASNIIISGNTFTNFHSNGVYLRETNGAIVSNNYFDKTTTSATSANAIQMAQAANINASIFNNDIQISALSNGSMTFRGIYLFNGTGHKVYNNVVHNISLTSGNFTGIEIRTGATSPEIYFNTIAFDNTAATTGNLYGIKEELTNTNSVLRNNMISITQPSSGIRTGLVLATNSNPAVAFNSDYNNIYVPGGNVAQKGSLSTIVYYPAMADWQAAGGQDMNSQVMDPMFLSPLVSQPGNFALDNKGTPIAWITTDILGMTRGPVPDIGAYEFSSAIPQPPDSIYGDTVVCTGEDVTYYVDPVAGASTYNWQVPPGAVILSGTGSPSVLVHFGLPGNWTISVTAGNAAGNSAPTTLNLTVLPPVIIMFSLPFDSICLSAGPVSLTAAPAGGTFSGPGVSGSLFSPSQAGVGTHQVIYTLVDTNGCVGTGAVTITVVVCTAVPTQVPSIGNIEVAPVPAEEMVFIKRLPPEEQISVMMLDHMGKKVRDFIVTGPECTINRGSLPAGMYLLRFRCTGGQLFHQKILFR